MTKTALITGASSGIGLEFSKIFAKNGYNLVLVSRNVERLQRISEEIATHGPIRIKLMPKDLCKAQAAYDLHDEIIADRISIDILVNNAGIGTHGSFVDIGPDRHETLIGLNITALTILCRLFGADMVKRGAGGILNVSSLAAFQAGPLMSTYYASKAYVLMFSEALREELGKQHVSVTVLCPGPTQTEFFERSNAIGTGLEKSHFMMTPSQVAEIGFEGLMKGKSVVVPGLVNKLLSFSVRLAPRKFVTAIAASLNQRQF
jgi:short-subunit dehydrogenase